MKLISKIAFSTLLAANLSFAGMVNGIAVIINNEPITLYEVYKYAEHFKVNRKDALDILVRQKLEDAEIKKLGIAADIFEVDAYIKKLAMQNNMSEFDFISMLKSQKVDMKEYKKDLKTKIKKDKFYTQVISKKVIKPDEKELQTFYDKNKEQFKEVSEFDVTVYSSIDKDDLSNFSKNPMLILKTLQKRDETLKTASLGNNLASLLLNLEVGKFSKIIPTQNGRFEMFQINNKKGENYISFDKIKNNLFGVIYKQREQKAISDYFEKLKSTASIKVLRNPS